jgi:hypothetical protein
MLLVLLRLRHLVLGAWAGLGLRAACGSPPGLSWHCLRGWAKLLLLPLLDMQVGCWPGLVGQDLRLLHMARQMNALHCMLQGPLRVHVLSYLSPPGIILGHIGGQVAKCL